MPSLIDLIDQPPAHQRVEILQLYDELELLRLDDPPHHTLFVLGRQPDAVALDSEEPAHGDRLLLIDPPPDLHERFRVAGDAAMLVTRVDSPGAPNLPRLATRPGGTAHIRLGRHFLDIHTQQHYTVVHFPALGIIYSGEFGSSDHLPHLAPGDNGDDALDTLRVLASLVKDRRVNLVIPRVGELGREAVPVMERLAADVAYIHNLRRVALSLAPDTSVEKLAEIAATLQPVSRRTAQAEASNMRNLTSIVRGIHAG